MCISFGSDPEFFLNFKGHAYHSAIDVVPGDVGNRHKIGDHQFYWDNVLAECAIKPGRSKDEVVKNFRECLTLYADLVSPFLIEARSSYRFDSSLLKDKKAKEVGCHPDVCAYKTKAMKPDLKVIKRTPFRSGGGHIHLGAQSGFLRGDGPKIILLVYLMDLFLAVPSLYIDHDPTSPERRLIYGHAGRYRPTNYGLDDEEDFATGIEYRPLGNFWLQTPEDVELIYDLTMFVVGMVENNEYQGLWDIDEDRFYRLVLSHKAFTPKYDVNLLQHCVKHSDLKNAKPLFDLALSHMPADLRKRVVESSLIQWQGRSAYRSRLYTSWGINT